MGPLFALIAAALLYFLLAKVIGFILVSIAKALTFLKRKPSLEVKSFFWFPFYFAPYFFLAMIINVFVCEYLRDVDAPLTDYWALPIKGGLTIGAIDTTEQWNLWPSRHGGESLVSDIAMAAVNEKALFGFTRSGEHFIYWFESQGKGLYLSEGEFELELAQFNFSRTDLKKPMDLYYDNRELGDLITFLLMLVYPGIRFFSLSHAFWKALNSQPSVKTLRET